MLSKKSNLPYLLLALVVAGSGLFYVASVAATFDSLLHPGRVRSPFAFSYDEHLFALLPEAQSAGMDRDDQIVSIDGQPFNGLAGVFREAYLAQHGRRFTIVYHDRAGAMRTALIPMMPQRTRRTTATLWVVVSLAVVLFPVFCLGLGYWVVLAKPWDRNAWFLLGIMNAVPALSARTGYFPGPIAAFTIFWQIVAFQWMLISLILFSVYFPVRSELDRSYPWAKWLMIAPQIPIAPYLIFLDYGLLYHARGIRPYLAAMRPLILMRNVYAVLTLGIFIAAVVRRLFHVADFDARRRLRVIAVGSLFGLGPTAILPAVLLFTGQPMSGGPPSWSAFVAYALIPLFPLSLAYTVIVQRAFDLRIILRQGTRYAFARGTLRALQLAIFLFMGYRLFAFSHNFGHRSVYLIAPAAFAAVVLFLDFRVAQPLSQWIDRRFFREAYSAEQILGDLAEQARSFTETRPLVETVVERIGQTLHVERIFVLLHEDGAYRLRHELGEGEMPDVAIREDSSLIRVLQRSRGRALVFREPPDPWVHFVASEDRAVLTSLHAELLLPMPGRTSLAGLMILGAKRSEEPYSRSDRQLLESVAAQTGLTIENSVLIHTLAEEAAHRERISREIEIAREVQQQLFPQSYPQVAGVALAGYCRTAQEVGGDYYDFIELENGRLGLAIGDVSGKGVSAALLMASVRSALHGLTLSGTLDLSRLMCRLNQIVYDSSTSNRFVTIFLAEYDPATRTLIYVNAGHNAPILLRADGRQVERLETGGPVIGILPSVEYRHGRLQLMRGDVLIGFTDGVSEADTADHREWGEEAVIEAAKSCASRSPEEIASRLIEKADAFTAGAPQRDDMAVVVLKVQEQPARATISLEGTAAEPAFSAAGS